jgi:hypothetical protein
MLDRMSLVGKTSVGAAPAQDPAHDTRVCPGSDGGAAAITIMAAAQ